MIAADIIHNTFHIKYNQGTGSSIVLEHNRREYLVTARHVVDNIKPVDSVMVERNGTWDCRPTRIVGVGDKSKIEWDIAVLAFDTPISYFDRPIADESGLTWGQDVYFLGFPYGLSTGLIHSRGYSVPFLKKGCFSGIVTEANNELYYIDAISNPGFSGGPVAFREANDRNKPSKVMGIVSSRRQYHEEILHNNLPTGLFASENTGIVLVPCIKNAMEIIRSKEIGPMY